MRPSRPLLALGTVLAASLAACSTSSATSSGALRIRGDGGVTSYTCQRFTVSAVDGAGAPVVAPAPVPVSLTGLGSGAAYARLVDCEMGSATTAVFIPRGLSEVDFYFRTSAVESLELRASAPGFATGTLAVLTSALVALGQSGATVDARLPLGVNGPLGGAIAGGKLYVADTGNNRVLVWNTLPASAGDAPSFALGQPGLSTSVANNGGLKTGLLGPRAVLVVGTKLVVADTGNHRVLVWNTLPAAGFTAPDVVLGQPDFTTSAANAGTAASAATLSSPCALASDGTQLFVADRDNNRVLGFATLPTTSGASASFVLGQASLAGTAANSGGPAVGMSLPQGAHVAGGKLYVADTGNHRVLAWNTVPSGAAAPDFAIGQPNLTTTTAGTSAVLTSGPTAIYGDGTKLYVSDTGNHRVLGWNTAPTASTDAADFALGQTLLTTGTANNGGISAGTLNKPAAVLSDGTRLFVLDAGNHRALRWNALPTSAGASDAVLGQRNATQATPNGGTPAAGALAQPAAVASDGTRLYVADPAFNRVLVWNALPTANGQAADFALGQPDLVSGSANSGGVSLASLSGPQGVWTDGTRLVVADTGNHRVLVWLTPPTAAAAPASFALGQVSGTTAAANAPSAATGMSGPTAVFGAGSRLFVADTGNHRVLVWGTFPSGGDAPTLVLGQASTTATAANGGGGPTASVMKRPSGIYSDGTRLFVADSGNNRILGWSATPTSTGAPATFALGQTTLLTGVAGVGASSLDGPTGLASDGMRLFASDTNNNRVLVWPSLPTGTAQPATLVIGQTSLTAKTAGLGAKSLSGPLGLYVESTRALVADPGNGRVLVLPTP